MKLNIIFLCFTIVNLYFNVGAAQSSHSNVSTVDHIFLHQRVDTLNSFSHLPSNADSLLTIVDSSSRTLVLEVIISDTINIRKIHYCLGSSVDTIDIVSDSLQLNPFVTPPTSLLSNDQSRFLLDLGVYSGVLRQYFLQVWLEDKNQKFSLKKVIYNK